MTPEELTVSAIEQFNAIAEKGLTVQQTAKVLVSMVRIMTLQFPTNELKQRFLAEFADEILKLSPVTPYSRNKVREKKPKRMCLRDKSKVCELCHECDIDISQPRY